MEGVGARLGRSSTRYSIGPATVFTGPVRKWKKKWVQVQPSDPNHHHHQAAANKAVNGISSVSHLLFYKWTPITPNLNKDGIDNNNGISNSDIDNAHSIASNREDTAAEEEPPRKKTKFIPIFVLEEHKNGPSEQIEDGTEPLENDSSTVEASFKSNGQDETPDNNDAPIDESQAQVPENNPVEQSDLNGRTLDSSLGLKVHEGDQVIKDGHDQNE